MLVRVYSRKQADKILFFDTPIISIRDDTAKPLRVKGTNVLHVIINDKRDASDISDDVAWQIAEFVYKNKDAPIMSVNCLLGVSRSSGVALAICEHFGIDFKNPSVYYEDYGVTQKYSPNPDVYMSVREALREYGVA